MGLKEGANLAATAANIKSQQARQLSQEEKDKIYMEIAKMNADIQKQHFDMQKEAHELKMQADSVKMQKDMQEHYAALINKAKVDKSWKRWNQGLLGGLNTPDMHQLAFMQAQEGIPPEPQRLARQKFIQEGFEPEETKPQSTVGKILADLNRLPEDHPMRGIYNKALEKAVAISGQKIEVGPDGRITVTQGPGAMTPALSKPTQTQTEKDILALGTQLNDLVSLKDDYSKEYLTYGGRLKGLALRTQSKMGMTLGKGSKEFVGGMRRFVEGVEQIFNQYRKEITGAQAAMKEIAMLRDSILNKKMSPDEFEYSFNRYVSQIQRQYRLKTKFLREGITDPKVLGKKIDQAYFSQEDTTDMDMDARGDEIAAELVKRGVPDNQIQSMVLKQLKNEGYY